MTLTIEAPSGMGRARGESPDNRLLSETNGRSMFVPRGDQYANVKDYLAPNRVPGSTDDWQAFEAARQTGRPVYAPAGHYYLSKAPAWGDGSVFRGDGKRKTVLHVHDAAPADVSLFTNANMTGNVQGYFADFTIDGNCMRQGGTLLAPGGSRGSTMVWRNVRHFYVDRVETVNPILHGFDVTRGALDYPYLGDGAAATLRSSDVEFFQCEATNFGDDGFTCHSSDNIKFTNCLSYNPRLRDNCNGFEIDGDSAHITLTGNRSFGCYAGVEVKGHGNESAAQDVTINGHHDTGSVRSYNFRHIGYHSGSNPVSKTARNITASNLVSINPNNDKGFQDDATPRALSISAYIGVSINGFEAVGRGGYGTGDIAIAVQFRSADINLAGVNVRGWTGAEYDLSVTTGDLVTVTGFTTRESANSAIYTGSGVTSFKLFGLQAAGPATGAYRGVNIYTPDGVEISGAAVTGYPTPVHADGTNYASVEAYGRRTRSIPASVTRLIDLDPALPYYANTDRFAALTDIPPGQGGGNWISHSNLTGDSVVQTVIRNTSGAGQVQSWRIVNFVLKTAGPWNRPTITQV
ncbi:glycosyl hydrolase family 28-related protein [Arthrobacter sp. CP30]